MLKRQGLELVDEVVQAHVLVLVGGHWRAFVIPCRPRTTRCGQLRHIGVQDGQVGLKGNAAKHLLLLRVDRAEQLQAVVAVAGHYHVVKVFGGADLGGGIGESNVNTCAIAIAVHLGDRRVEPAVRQLLNDGLNVLAGTTCDGIPSRTVGDLNQAVVVTKLNQGGDWKSQHLLCGTTPNAA